MPNYIFYDFETSGLSHKYGLVRLNRDFNIFAVKLIYEQNKPF